MSRCLRLMRHLCQLAYMLLTLGVDAIRVRWLGLRSPAALAAENLFLRKQLALYQARHVHPKRATDATRFTLVWLSHWFDWQQALAVVQPQTFMRWRRHGWGVFWYWITRPGRPRIPVELQALIRQMACDNLTWGQRRIANELWLKLGLRVSPRTVRKYMPRHLDRAPGQHVPSQRWRTFLRNHAQALIISGVAVDLTQGIQALAACLIWSLQRWWDGAVTSRGQEIPPCAPMAMALLRASVSGLAGRGCAQRGRTQRDGAESADHGVARQP
jgi:putative transposase